MSSRRWTHETAAKVAQCLAERFQIVVSATVVRRLLGELNYSLKSNRKCLSSGNSPDRDEQFKAIKRWREQFRRAGDPIISVDTKKKELIGRFKNPGQTWCREAKRVKDHDFRSEALAIVSPYGIYDLQKNAGVLVVGQSADTPEFAVNSIVTWWLKYGRSQYPTARRLLILADSGGSNGARLRAWKKYLQEKLSDPFGLTITVAHYPTGTSKWNPIEHRMFSEISKNWAGVPLESFEILLNLVRNTKTATGLRVEACRDQRQYNKGIGVSDKEMRQLALTKSDFLDKWNYKLSPRPQDEKEDLAPRPEASSIPPSWLRSPCAASASDASPIM